MKIDFQRAFAVAIRHGYYPDGIGEDLRIEPTADCHRTLQRHGLLFKETPGGFVVLYETTGAAGPPEPKRPLNPPLNLAFALRSRSPHLVNFTDLPLDKAPRQIFYLTNRNKTLTDGQPLLSAASGSEFLSASDLLELRPQRFQVAVESAASALLWELLDALGTLVDQQRVGTVEGTCTYAVDLAGRPPGRYLLRRDGVEHLSFYASDQLVGEFPFGLIEIAVDAKVSADFSFLANDGKVQFRSYSLKLDARKTTWEYYVVAKYETKVKPTDLSLTLEDPPVIFNRLAAVTLADGSTAIPFVADTPLPLTRRPLKGITLNKKKGESTPKLDIDSLPNPSVAEIIPAAGGQVISRVYLYV